MVLEPCPGFTTLNNNGLVLKVDDACMSYWSNYKDEVLVTRLCDGKNAGYSWKLLQ